MNYRGFLLAGCVLAAVTTNVENDLAVSAVDPGAKLTLSDGPSGAVYEGGKLRWRPEIDQVGSHKLIFELISGDQTQRQTVEITAQFAAHRFGYADNIFRFDRLSAACFRFSDSRVWGCWQKQVVTLTKRCLSLPPIPRRRSFDGIGFRGSRQSEPPVAATGCSFSARLGKCLGTTALPLVSRALIS